MTERLLDRFMDCTGMTMLSAESYGTELARWQKNVMFWLGDLAKYSEARWPDTHHQVWPDWVSPGMIARAIAVAQAYPRPEDREHDATWTQFMRLANRGDRQEQLAAIVDKGLTSDESAKVDSGKPRWLLAFDVNYYLHRYWHSGAGVESAMSVASWIQRTVERLRESHGLTDVVCCFDGARNFRKELTKDWEDAYKPRPPKDPELVNQLTLVHQLLEGHGFICAKIGDMEADDVMASFGTQFNGRTTIVSADKDLRQVLSHKCNVLLDVVWHVDETTGDNIPDYKWLSAKQHTEATGIPPASWVEYQALMGDNVDGIKGAIGIGAKGAADLIKEFGTAAGAIQAAKEGSESIRPKKREALIEFEPKLETTLQLVLLRTDLELPKGTRI